jgi:hypothetical protein
MLQRHGRQKRAKTGCEQSQQDSLYSITSSALPRGTVRLRGGCSKTDQL